MRAPKPTNPLDVPKLLHFFQRTRPSLLELHSNDNAHEVPQSRRTRLLETVARVVRERLFFKNKRSSVRRAAKRTFESGDHNYRPGNVHDKEWDKAMGELEDERAAGARAHTGQV